MAVEQPRLPADLVVGHVFLGEGRGDRLLREGIDRGVQPPGLRPRGHEGVEEVVRIDLPVQRYLAGQVVAREGLVLLLVEEGRELRDEEEDVVGGRPFRVAEPALQLQP